MKISKIIKIIKRAKNNPVDQNWLKNSRQTLQSFIIQNPVRKPRLSRQIIAGGIFKKLFLKPMPIAIIALIISLATGSGVVAAALGSLPTDTLYPVKIVTEQIQEAVTFDNAKKIELSIKLAEKRLSEIKQLQAKGEVPSKTIEETLVKYEKHLINAQSQLASFSRGDTAPKLIAAAVKYENSLENQQKELTALTSQVSVESQPSLAKAQKAIIANSNKALDKIEIKIKETETSEAQANTGAASDKTEVLPSVLMEKVPEYISGIDEKTKNRIKTAENKLAEIRKKINNFADQKENKCDLVKKQAYLEKLEIHYQKMAAALTEAQKLFGQKNYLAALNQANYVMILAIDADNLIGQWRRDCDNLDKEPVACKAPSCLGAYQTGEYDSDNCPVYKCPNNEAIRVVTLNQKFDLKTQETVGVENENIQITLNKIRNTCPPCPAGVSCSMCLAPTAQLEISYSPDKKAIQSINLGLNRSEAIGSGLYLKLLNFNEENYITLILNKSYGCDVLLNCVKGTTQHCSDKYDKNNCPICACEPIACQAPNCTDAYQTGEYDSDNCPVYKCPVIKGPLKECKVLFSNCNCAYNCVEVIEGQALNDCMRACSVDEINNYKPNCGYQNGVCQDLSQVKPCPLYSPPALDWCKNGKIYPGETDSSGCQGPARCIQEVEVESDESSNSTQSSQGESNFFEPILKFLQLK